MTDQNDYSEALWQKDAAYLRWRRFMSHDWGNPSRYLAYYLMADYIWGREDKVTVAEIGFGDCFDFRWFFRLLHDMGKVEYTGYEIMPEFVRHAKDDYFLYDTSFRVGGFMDLQPDSYDLVYTRHTLEHARPTLWRDCLATMLWAAKGSCVLTWYMPPAPTRLMEENWTGDGWQNAYYEKDVREIIDAAGMELEVWELDSGDHVYRMDRTTAE